MHTRKDYANALRALAMDAVQKAQSGHPGMPMGMADIAEVLWNDFLKHAPHAPHWPNRDRFILSNGHGSMLHYALLHLSGYDLSLDELKHFRQLHSKTPGHPEVHLTPGVETTTGPLGQGFANAVGMAIAEKVLAAQFNRDTLSLIDHYTYVFLGDGCLMEGISHEVASYAGTLKLGKLIAFYDDNAISIDGPVAGWFTDNTQQRFQSYQWHVVADVDGHNPDAIAKAIRQAQAVTDKPSLIICKTLIGYGAPTLAGDEKCHGAPLGDQEIAGARAKLGWPYPPFEIPTDIQAHWDASEKGRAAENQWNELFAQYAERYPTEARELKRRLHGELPESFDAFTLDWIQRLQSEGQAAATRASSLHTLNHLGAHLPECLGGSADLTGSNLTLHEHSTVISAAQFNGNYLHYGVREFGMAAMMNGMALHGGFIPYGGTFLVFLDYARNAVRLSAMMKQRVIYVFTHDSIGLGEDGPTHQPIEHATMLRITPNMAVWRPCDDVETAVAWQQALSRHDGPSGLLLTRQKVAHQARDSQTVANIQRGGYVLRHGSDHPDVILIATGSEVEIAMRAAEELSARKVTARVVSMPSTDRFDQQDAAYRDSVLPPEITCRIAIEAGATAFWYRYVGARGSVLGIDSFGESAPYNQLYQHFGLDSEHIIAAYERSAL